MKVFIDILTPKQCMLFAKLSERLRRDGHEVYEVTREYREVNQLLKMKGIRARVVGKHGGRSLRDKLESSAQRVRELVSIAADFAPDMVVSFSSPETSRVAFGLSIPHVCLNDSPHSESVARLTVPLATLLLTPTPIPKKAWIRFGIQPDRIVQYNALDPWAWLKDFKPDEQILSQLNLEKSRPIVVFRTEEAFASYLQGKISETPPWLPLLKDLLKSSIDFQAVVVPRYEAQVTRLTRILRNRAVVCKSVIDSPSLLAHTSVFVGAGGTMTAEAALLGVPTFSCYPDEPYLVEKYLIKEGLVARETNHTKMKTMILKALTNNKRARMSQKAKANRLTSTFEDPVDVIVETIQQCPSISLKRISKPLYNS